MNKPKERDLHFLNSDLLSPDRKLHLLKVHHKKLLEDCIELHERIIKGAGTDSLIYAAMTVFVLVTMWVSNGS